AGRARRRARLARGRDRLAPGPRPARPRVQEPRRAARERRGCDATAPRRDRRRREARRGLLHPERTPERRRRRPTRQADRRADTHRPPGVPGAQAVTEVTPAEARRIAVRAQLLDGSAKDVLSTVRHLGRLQIDPISTVAPPQYLVLWSRLGLYDREELDRLLFEQRKLFEWKAFIYPIEDLPLIRALMREPWSHL